MALSHNKIQYTLCIGNNLDAIYSTVVLMMFMDNKNNKTKMHWDYPGNNYRQEQWCDPNYRPLFCAVHISAALWIPAHYRVPSAVGV